MEKTQLVDLRYPFTSIFQFYSEGYLFQRASLHLLIGHLGIALIIFWAIFKGRKNLVFAFICLFISLNFASNPSLKIGLLCLSDLFIFAAGALTITSNRIRFSKNYIWIFFGLGLVALHSIFTFILYELGDLRDLCVRFVLAGRLFAVAFAMYIFTKKIKAKEQCLNFFSKLLSLALLLSTVVYVTQILMYKSGIIPYGTMPSAGFGGIRFGGLSMEGGHLSKFIFPMIITSVILARLPWQKVVLIFGTAVFLINVSASGYSFLVFFLCAAGGVYGYLAIKKRSFLRIFCLGIFGIAFACTTFIATNNGIIRSLLDKIEDAISSTSDVSQDTYGRSPEILLRSLAKFPLGIGYSGSTQRNIAMPKIGLPTIENNLGFNAFFAQFSVFGIFLLMLFIYKTADIFSKSAAFTANNGPLNASIVAAIPLTVLFILAVDILWALPQLWALVAIARNKSSEISIEVGAGSEVV